jgi:hypothetical protein
VTPTSKIKRQGDRCVGASFLSSLITDIII